MATQPLMNVFNRLSVAFDHGEGAWLYDTDGNKYLDALCGIAVTGLGHAHPAITRAISSMRCCAACMMFIIPVAVLLRLLASRPWL